MALQHGTLAAHIMPCGSHRFDPHKGKHPKGSEGTAWRNHAKMEEWHTVATTRRQCHKRQSCVMATSFSCII
ncbi:MAG: hypothetical protein MRZ57_09190 [Bacteroidales bacterium]|nr:hypothetical protein [Bacteroidales bacterium]